MVASEIGLSANALEQPANTDLQTEDNIVKKYFIFSRSTLGLLLFRGESGGDTLNGWYRTQKVVLNVSTTRNIALASAADGRRGYLGEVAGVCDAAETKCVGCSFTDQGVVCTSNTGLVTPIHWYHVILAAQAPGGIIVADYFCNLANKSSRDCYTEAMSILPSRRVIGPPANR